MKKVLLIAALLGMGSALMAQAPQKCNLTAEKALEKAQKINQQSRSENTFTESLDSISYLEEGNDFFESYQYDLEGRNLVKTTFDSEGGLRLTSTYENDLIKTIEHHRAENGSTNWEHKATEIYTYDDNDNLILFEYNAFNFGEWGITDRYEYTYDEQNRILSDIGYSYDLTIQEMVPSYKRLFYYTENTTATESYSYHEDLGGWYPSSKIIDTFLESGYICENLQLSWDDEAQDFLNDYRGRFEYDANNNIITTQYHRWVNGEWILENKTTGEYDSDNHLIAAECQSVNQAGELQPYLHYEYEYDSNGNRCIAKNYRFLDTEYCLTDLIECIYDLTVNSEDIMGCIEQWNSKNLGLFSNALDPSNIPMRNKWTLRTTYSIASGSTSIVTPFYSVTTGVDENGSDIRAKIYGTNGKIIVISEAMVDVSIYDMAGRNVATRSQVSECEISLKAGLYIVKAGDAAIKVVVR